MNRPPNFCIRSAALLLSLAIISIQTYPAHGLLLQKPDSPPEETTQEVRIDGAIVTIIESAQVPAELPGVLSKLVYREGQHVNEGDLLAQIKSNDLSLELKRAQARHKIALSKAENQVDIQFAKKSAEVSSARLNRSRISNQKAPGVVPRGRLQELELEVHRDKLRIEQATRDTEVAKMEMELSQADVELSMNAIQKADLLAPLSGVVVLIETNIGEWVKPGDTVVKIVRLDRLRLEGFVSASQVGKVKINSPAKISFDQKWLEVNEVKGKVVFVNPEANPVNSQVEVWVEIDNPTGQLLPGLEASIEIDCSVVPE